MRVRSWIIWIGAGVLALPIALALVLAFVDPTVFRGQIEARVRQATGRPFQLQGDLDIAWFPWLAVRTGPASLGNPAGMDGPPMLQWESARVGARLIPLLRGRLVIDRVRLDGAHIRLYRTEDGRTNWEDLTGSSTDGQSRREMQIGGIELRDAVLDYRDERTGTHLRLQRWSAELGSWAPGEPVDLETEFDLAWQRADAAKPVVLQTRFSTEATVDEDFTRLELQETELEGTLQAVPVRIRLPKLAVSFAPLALSADAVKVNVADAELTASARLDASESGDAPMKGEGEIQLHVPSVRALLGRFGIETEPADATALGPLDLRSRWAYLDGAMTVEPIEIRLDETRLSGTLHRSGSNPALWRVALHGDRIDLARYVPREDPDAEPFELPVQALRDLPLEGEITFEQAKFADASVRTLRLRFESDSAGDGPEAP